MLTETSSGPVLDGTLTRDIADSVAVTDFVRHKTIILHADQSYLAKPIHPAKYPTRPPVGPMRPPHSRWLPRPCESEREIVTSERDGPSAEAT